MHYGFKLINDEKIKRHNLQLLEFEHKKTGAKVVWLKNKDQDVTFAIEFFTPPKDNRGVAHILEHSVLMGSQKYVAKSRDLFSLLLSRKSMTYVNAMTYPERTQYPISTINKKDFIDVMRVYLDAVFSPLLLNDKNIFRQEGWRVEKDVNGKFVYNGTVLNEMRSALSNPHGQIFRALLQNSFLDGPYKYESGGNPNEIVDLDYKQAIKFYKKHYHPSNSKTFLYGEIDIEKTLNLLDEYFSRYIKVSSPKLVIKKHKSVHKVNVKLQGKNKEDSCFAMSFYAENMDKLKDNLILSFIWTSLLEKESDFLKAFLRATGKAGNILYEFEDYIAVNTANLILTNVDAKNFVFLEKAIRRAFLQVSQHGLDVERIQAIMDRMQLTFAELTYGTKRGINYLEAVSKMWNFAPSDTYLKIENVLDEIRIDFSKNPELFDVYFKKYFIDANNYTVVKAKASPKVRYFNLLYRKETALNNLSMTNKDKLKKEAEAFKAWQELRQRASESEGVITPSRPDGFPKKLHKYKVRKFKKFGIQIYHHKVSNKKVNQAHLFFDLSHMSHKDFQRAKVLLSAFKRMPAAQMTRKKLDALESCFLGSINFVVSVARIRDTSAMRYAVLDFDYLSKNTQNIFEILNNYINSLALDADILRSQLNEILNDMRVQIRGIMAYHFATLYASRAFSEFDFVSDELSGLGFVEFLKSELKLSDKELLRRYSSVYKNMFYLDNLSASIVNYDSDEFVALIKLLRLKSRKLGVRKMKRKIKMENTAIKVSGLDGNFNVEIFSMNKFYPEAYILASILRLKDLWKKIREEGGAYGAFFTSRDTDGLSIFASYNDPHIARSYNIYKKVFTELEFSEEDFYGAKSNALLDNFFIPKPELYSAYEKLLQDKCGFTDKYYDFLFEKLQEVKHEDLIKLAKKMQKKQTEYNIKVSIVKDFPTGDDKLFKKTLNLDL